MSTLREAFDERLEEVHAYLDFLRAMETQTQKGAPRFEGAEQAITPQQQKLLYASLYLQLYNLVEATMTRCLEAVTAAAAADERWVPQDLAEPLRHEWIRSQAKTSEDLSPENRHLVVVGLIDRVLKSLPLEAFEIRKGGGGNWADDSIEKMSHRLGCKLAISAPVKASVKQHVKDNQGSLQLVKTMRNRLAHGNMSFAEAAEGFTVTDLNSLARAVIDYMGEVVDRFVAYVDGHEYLIPTRRPAAGA
jgi:MAE_28990/MAE_18760-like HEPN